jgi:hypothetical protein
LRGRLADAMVDPTLVTDFLFAVLGDGVAVRR